MGRASQELKHRLIEWGSAMGSAVGFIRLGEIFENRFCIGAIGLMAGIVVYAVVRHFNKENSKPDGK